MAATDKPIVLFGGGGFLGRNVAQILLSQGYRIRIVQRDPGLAMALRPLANMGQIQFVAADITRSEAVAPAVADAGAVINFVGLLAGDMQAAHVAGARNIAQAAAASGVEALVQVSAIGADPASTSAYGRTKGEGEQVVREAYPAATIIRPSIIFGRDDGFTNRFAGLIATGASIPPLRIVPVIRGACRFQPVSVGDVARAIAMAATQPGTFGGNTYELGGPDVMTLAQINSWIATEIGRPCTFVPVPDGVACALATATGWLPGAPITRDQFRMLGQDNVVAPGARGFSDFGIEPAPMAALAPSWLAQYRRQGRQSDATAR